MPLVPATISSTVKNHLDTEYGAATGAALAEREKFCNALGAALDEVLKTQLQIAVTATIASFGTPPPWIVVVT